MRGMLDQASSPWQVGFKSFFVFAKFRAQRFKFVVETELHSLLNASFQPVAADERRHNHDPRRND
jgi:hypothetical protein